MSRLPPLPSGNDPETIDLTHDEVLVLFELFERLEEEDNIKFAHPAEWIALGRLTAQFVYKTWEPFGADYYKLLGEARARRSQEFEGHVTGLGYVRV